MRSFNIFLVVLFGILAFVSAERAKQNYALGGIQPSGMLLEQKDYLVYGSLVTPQARGSSTFDSLSDAVCGGTSSDSIHLVTTTEYPTRFQWYIHTPFADSTCLVRLSQTTQAKDKDFAIIAPADNGAVNEDGSFPCGRTGPTVESRVFTFQANLSCDHGVVEWIWKTPKGSVRQCADITITPGNSTTTSRCPSCQNGGFCSKNKCVCPKGSSGDICQLVSALAVGGGSYLPWIILGVILIVLIGVGACVGLRNMMKPKKRVSEHNKSYEDFRRDNSRQDVPQGGLAVHGGFKPFEDEQ